MKPASRLALVTSGNRGLGLGTCRQLAARGLNGILTSRDPARGRAAVDDLSGEGLTLVHRTLDVTHPDDIEATVEFVQSSCGRLDVLVNNAGIYLGEDAGVLDLSLADFRQTMETNFYGPLLLCRSFAPLMRRQGDGRIVSVSSGYGALSEMGGPEAPPTPTEGADTTVWLATLPPSGPSGGFFRDRRRIAWQPALDPLTSQRPSCHQPLPSVHSRADRGGIPMRYKLLGRSGLRVSELCLGTMTFGEAWGWGAGKDESQRIFDSYASAGGNFIDTANRYTDGQSESYVGEFIASDRDHFVLATKFTLFDRKGDPNFSGNHRKNLVRSVEASLRRLNTDRIDLLWMHAWDGLTPVEEVMRSLDDLVRTGKVLYVGVSDTPAWVVSQANTLAALRGWTPFAALQISYSLIERTPERDLLPMARALDLAVAPWAILGRGILSGKYANAGLAAQTGRAAQWGILHARSLQIAAAVTEIAQALGCSPAQVAINWLRQQPGVIVPILGARTLDQLRDNLACLEHSLPPEQAARLDETSRIELGFPHEFLASDGVRDVVFGGTFEQIDRHRPPGA